jgi:signal transduction histidine kinase
MQCRNVDAVPGHGSGCGFRPGQGDGGPGPGYGLPAMRARVEQVGATVAVESGPGAGTAVRVSVPA